jgi:hypothetical protein
MTGFGCTNQFPLWAVCYAVLGGLWFFLVQPVSWVVLGVPAAFISVSFKGNGTEQLKTRLDRDISGWRSRHRYYFEAIKRTYNDLHRWFIEGRSY